jgi:hypothetical protein
MPIQRRFSGPKDGANGAGQGDTPEPTRKPPARLKRPTFDKKVVNSAAPEPEVKMVEEGVEPDTEPVDDKLAELADRVVALEITVRELTIKVEEHEGEIDALKKLVNANGDIAQRMARTTEDVAESLDRANGLMQALTAMVSTIIPLFQQLDRPQPRGLFDCLRRIQEEHDHIRMVVLPRAMQDSANVEDSVHYVDETRH